MKVLLLNFNYEVLSFIIERKALKLIFKNKVDVVSTWTGINWHYASGFIPAPAILRLKYFVKKVFSKLSFSRKAVFKRDKYACVYCGKALKSDQATIDHIIPKSMGGISSFNNCVAACYPCNRKKGNRTLEQADMKLKIEPVVPIGHLLYVSDEDQWHQDWNNYFGR